MACGESTTKPKATKASGNSATISSSRRAGTARSRLDGPAVSGVCRSWCCPPCRLSRSVAASKCCRGSRNSQDVSTNGAVSAGRPSGASATFMRRLHDDGEHRAQRGIDRHARARAMEHRAQRDRGEHRAETQQPGADQLALGAEQVRAGDCQHRAGQRRTAAAASELTANPARNSSADDPAALQEHLRDAVEARRRRRPPGRAGWTPPGPAARVRRQRAGHRRRARQRRRRPAAATRWSARTGR